MPGSRRPRVLLLDAHLRHSVAIVRSLGRAGVDVVCASPERWPPSGASRYASARRTVCYDDSRVLQRVLSLIDDEAIDVVIAAGLPGNEFICRHRAMLEPVVIAPYNDYATFDRLSNKARVVELAEALDIPRPRTVELTSLDDIERRVENLGYPIVFKSAADQGTVEYARNLHQLTRIMRAFWIKNEKSNSQRYFSYRSAVHPGSRSWLLRVSRPW